MPVLRRGEVVPHKGEEKPSDVSRFVPIDSYLWSAIHWVTKFNPLYVS